MDLTRFILPDYIWLCWLLYVLVLMGISWQARVLTKKLAWLSPELARNVTRIFVYVMCIPCIVIYDWRPWLTPAVPVLMLAILDFNWGHLFSACLSFGLTIWGIYYYRHNRQHIDAWWLHFSRQGTLVRHALNIYTAIQERLAILWGSAYIAIINRCQRK